MPLTWEIPAAIVLSWLVLALAALPAGQALASLVTGDGLLWPHGLVASALHLVQGEPGAGLALSERASLPPTGAVYAGVVTAEGLVALLGAFALVVWWRTGGPGTQWGIARRRDVVPVLGVRNLRERRHLIRPDLYGKAGRP